MGFLLHHSIDDSAERDPTHEAYRFEGAGLTYEQLVRQANQLANVLIDEGVRPGDRVGIFMHKGLELPVALYGILKAGAAYVPIDPATPTDRIEFIARDCGLRHLMTGASRARQTAELVDRDVGIQSVIGAAGAGTSSRCRFIQWQEIGTADARTPRARVTEQDLAYIMYTSGSTGAPKGLDAHARQWPELRAAVGTHLRRWPRRPAGESFATALRHVDVRIPDRSAVRRGWRDHLRRDDHVSRERRES